MTQRLLEAGYGLGRLGFGAGLIAVPGPAAGVLLDERGQESGARIFARSYGTRDTVLGVGILGAIALDADTRPWLAAGLMSDLLDVAVQAGEWDELPTGKRSLGVLAALGAAAAGAWLLTRER